jgi:hypothetical protein
MVKYVSISTPSRDSQFLLVIFHIIPSSSMTITWTSQATTWLHPLISLNSFCGTKEEEILMAMDHFGSCLQNFP